MSSTNNSKLHGNNADVQSTARPERFLRGSIHRWSQGYGYGGVVPTPRNTPTPSTVPQYRYSEDTRPFAPTSSVIIAKDDKSIRRNAQQLFYQTSGDYGKFLLDIQPERVRLNMQPRQDPNLTVSRYGESMRRSKDVYIKIPKPNSARSNNYSGYNNTINSSNSGFFTSKESSNNQQLSSRPMTAYY